jgi:hypothetical protein
VLLILQAVIVNNKRTDFFAVVSRARKTLLQITQIPDISSNEGAVLVLGTRKFHRGLFITRYSTETLALPIAEQNEV